MNPNQSPTATITKSSRTLAPRITFQGWKRLRAVLAAVRYTQTKKANQ